MVTCTGHIGIHERADGHTDVPGSLYIGQRNGQSALSPMCDAEKDWHECSFRASGAINGCQKYPLPEPEIKFSFFIFGPPVVYFRRKLLKFE